MRSLRLDSGVSGFRFWIALNGPQGGEPMTTAGISSSSCVQQAARPASVERSHPVQMSKAVPGINLKGEALLVNLSGLKSSEMSTEAMDCEIFSVAARS